MADIEKTIEIIFASTDRTSSDLKEISRNTRVLDEDLKSLGERERVSIALEGSDKVSAQLRAVKEALESIKERKELGVSLEGDAIAYRRLKRLKKALKRIKERKEVVVIFKGLDKASKKLKKISKGVNLFGKEFTKLGAPFLGIATGVALLDAAIAGIAVAGIKISSEIEDAGLKMQKSLRLPTQEAEKFGKIAKEVYTAGFGDDLSAAFEAVTVAQRKFGNDASVNIGKVTKQALDLESVFGVDLADSMDAIVRLTKDFGLDSEVAFGFVAKGFQDGLDGSGDFLDSIGEYSEAFAKGDADAGQFFSALEAGFRQGIPGIDDATDAIIEFRKMMLDNSDDVKEALDLIGIDNVALRSNITSGETTITDAFNTVIKKLNDTTDETIKTQAGVVLIGDKFEEFGREVPVAIEQAKIALKDFNDAAESLSIDSYTDRLEEAWRLTVTSFGDLEIWEEAKQKIAALIEDIVEDIPRAFKGMDLSGIVDAVDVIWNQIGDIFVRKDLDLTTFEGLQDAIGVVTRSMENIIEVAKGLVEALEPVIGLVLGLIRQFSNLSDGTKAVITRLITVGLKLAVLGKIVATGGALIGGLSKLLKVMSGPAGLVYAFLLFADVTDDVVKKLLGLDDATNRIRIAEKAAQIKKSLEEIELPEEMRVRIYAELDKGNFEKAHDLLKAIPDEVSTNIDADAPIDPLKKYVSFFEEIPADVSTRITAAIEAGAFDQVESIIAGISIAEINPIIKDGSISAIKRKFAELEFYSETEGWQTIRVLVEPEVDKAKAANEAEELAKIIDPLKTLEIITKLDIKEVDQNIAKINADAKTVQTSVEWKAKLDIAQVEAASKSIKASFGSINKGIESTGNLISSALASMGQGEGFLKKWAAQDILRQEQEFREQEFTQQKALIDHQTKYLELKNKAFEKTGGEMEIKIDSTGLEPSLEMVMWEIIQKVQVRASESASEFLLGLPT